MKKKDEKLNRFIRERMYAFRFMNSYSQEQMAEKLDITPRCYLEQEKGRCGFSGQTICRFLFWLSDEELLSLTRGLKTNVWKEEAENVK